MVLMRLEKPLFFRSRLALESFCSSEYRFEFAAGLVSFLDAESIIGESPVVKLADWTKVGVVILGSGLECDMVSGEGVWNTRERLDFAEDLRDLGRGS